MAEDDVQELSAEERLLHIHKKERKELQGASDGVSIFPSVSSREFLRHFRKAVSVPFSLNEVCSPPVHHFVTTQASSLGCSEKCLFFPLLTCCAACMGVDSYLELTAEWHEPPILWTLVLTPTTLKRIDVMEYLQQLLLLVQDSDGGNNFGVVQTFEIQYINKFVINFFKYTELHEMLTNNRGHAFGMYSNIQTLRELSPSSADVEVLHKLHNGSSWITCPKGGRGSIMKTSVNFTTFSKPSTLHHLLTKGDNFSDLLQACFLIICAEEKYVKFSQLPSVSSSVSLQRLFYGVLQLHASANTVYKLSPEARNKFGQIHDEFYEKARQASRKNMNGRIFQNALSYLGRLCCVLHVLENIVEAITWNLHLDPLTWNTEINENTVWHARQILNFALEQRYALLEDYVVRSVEVNQCPMPVVGRISNQITLSSDIASRTVRRIIPPINNVFNPRANSIQGQGTTTNNLQNHGTTNTIQSPVIARNNIQNLGITRNNIQNPGITRNNIQSPVITRNNIQNQVTTRNSIQNKEKTICPSDSSMDLNIVPISVEEIGASKGEPTIVSVRSAGLPVGNNGIAPSDASNNSNITNLPPDLSLPPSVSVSVISEAGTVTPVSSPNKAPLPSTPTTPVSVPGAATSPQLTQPIEWMPDNVFMNSYKVQIRKLLTYTSCELTPLRCVQLILTPDSSSNSSTMDDPKRPKLTSSYARHFLLKVAGLGFGMGEGPTRDNIRHYMFRKKPLKELGIKQKQILTELGISETEYEKCFWTSSDISSQTITFEGTLNNASNGGTEQKDVVVLD